MLLLNEADPEGHYCPLCEVAKHVSPEEAESWIVGASKAAVEHAQTLKRGDEKTGSHDAP
jgi:hypothetical protein